MRKRGEEQRGGGGRGEQEKRGGGGGKERGGKERGGGECGGENGERSRAGRGGRIRCLSYGSTDTFPILTSN